MVQWTESCLRCARFARERGETCRVWLPVKGGMRRSPPEMPHSNASSRILLYLIPSVPQLQSLL
jgi:hypothetical protein